MNNVGYNECAICALCDKLYKCKVFMYKPTQELNICITCLGKLDWNGLVLRWK